MNTLGTTASSRTVNCNTARLQCTTCELHMQLFVSTQHDLAWLFIDKEYKINTTTADKHWFHLSNGNKIQ